MVGEGGNRSMNSYELRDWIEVLTKQLQDSQNHNGVLYDWNERLQKKRWNEELAREYIKGFLKMSFRGKMNGFSTNEIMVLAYLCSLQGDKGNQGLNKAERHVRGISRTVGIDKSACSTALKRLQQKKLVMARRPNNYKKEFYTLPATRELVKEIQAPMLEKKTTNSAGTQPQNFAKINN